METQKKDRSTQRKVTILQHEKENNSILATQGQKEYFSLHDVPIVLEGCNIVPENKEDFNIKEGMKQILRMQAASQLTLQDIKQRILKLENALKNRSLNLPGHNDELITEFLPLTNKERIKEFESMLKSTEEAVT
ncbi:uncharacterized protein LOC105184885 [Harpegnathos saltator]|uniref:uncharacterized protein LOC105184885 n=1 Tax=Harpegnathos saltator TaxID=610380 RepID=UPI00058D9A2B|nr:uncharacterized protein LOC105184885 [Harpegnathos saltator]